MLDPLARNQGVTLTVQAPARAFAVRTDPGQLQQVVTNLVLNGVQAMTEGGRLEIAVGGGRVTPPGNHGGRPGEYYWFTVTDTGPGIEPEHLPHIFEPFFTTKAVGGGTGLGLCVAQAIVEEHGGWIAVESEVGRGTRFTVYLPPAPADRLAS